MTRGGDYNNIFLTQNILMILTKISHLWLISKKSKNRRWLFSFSMKDFSFTAFFVAAAGSVALSFCQKRTAFGAFFASGLVP